MLASQDWAGLCVPEEPAELLVAFRLLLPFRGLALDVACGEGRNSLFLARQGLSAVAVDRSREALKRGREAVVQENLPTAFVQADLTCLGFPEQSFCVIVCFKYRDPALYPRLRAWLSPGGLLIYQTYTWEHRRFGRRPQSPVHLLARGELLDAFGDWQVIFYGEEWIRKGVASLVARKPQR
jgi:tellurite methyltransferase